MIGLGIALESTRLAEREIADGRLIPILENASKDVCYVGLYLVFPQLACGGERCRSLCGG